MRTMLLILWLLVPVGAAAYHLGPGQERTQLDDAARLLTAAEEHALEAARLQEDPAAAAEARYEWAAAESLYEQALGLLPEERVRERRALRLEHAKCRMMVSELPEASAELQNLVDEMLVDGDADSELLFAARDAYASSQYYMTWLKRLEGLSREEWEPNAESARQTYKLLLEQEPAEEERERLAEDLESAVRLARMELSELQGLPLPSQ